MKRGRRRFMRGSYFAGPMMMGYGRCGGHTHRGGFLSVEDEIAMLEEAQRDLEEAAADVAERIRRLEEKQSEPVDA